MAKHNGFRMTKRPGKNGITFTVQVWNRDTKCYNKARSFNSRDYLTAKQAEVAAKNYGTTESAKITAGIKSHNAGRIPTAELLVDFFESRKKRMFCEKHEQDMQRVLRNLSEFCPDLGDDSADEQIEDWWTAYTEEPKPGGAEKSIETKNRALVHVKTFVRWVFSQKKYVVIATPVDGIEKITSEKTIKKQFTIAEIKHCLGVTVTRRGGIVEQHPFVIRWALYVFLGLRAREALALRWEDFTGGHVLIKGKGRKERLVIMQDGLRPYLQAHKDIGHDYTGYLFPEHIRNCGSSDPAKRLNSFLRKAGIERNGRTTHSLRHCYAGIMVATGEATGVVQDYMGHSTGDMTMHYAQLAARYREDVEGWERGKIMLFCSSQP